MTKEKFILLSLKEDESKKLAQIISNDTSRKILDYLAEKEATESELATSLNIPISTIHYNLQALLKGRLIEADEYHYSQKGKEVLHYKLANKYIIIAPKSTFGIKEKLRSILPVGIFVVIGTFLIQLYHGFVNKGFSQTNELMVATQQGAAVPAMDMVKTASAESARAAVEKTVNGGVATQSVPIMSYIAANPALWFLIGCLFTILLVIVVEYIVYKRQR